MLSIDRFNTKWDGYNYRCRMCDEEATSVASITHEDDCTVSNPDDVPLAHLDDSTVRQLREIILTVISRRREVKYVDDLPKDELKQLQGVKWVDSGSSTRLIFGLGQTNRCGEYHLEDERGLVLKLDPNVRTDTEYTPVSANIDELYTWEKAVETNTSHLFADILGCSLDGAWLLMEECLPIYPSIQNEMKYRDALADVDRDKYITPFINSLNEHNWYSPDYKHGNIGLNQDGNTVLLDYGTGPEYNRHK